MLILKTMLQYLTDLDFFGLFMKIIRTIFLALDGVIYTIISYCYEVFNFISEIRVFENQDMVNLANRIYILIGVVSLFLVAYTLLNAIINPENASKDKNKSFTGIIKNITLAIIGIAVIPTIFDYAYEFQSRVLCNNVIPKFFLENNVVEDDDARSKVGAQMSLYLFKSFYYIKGSEDNVTVDENGVSNWETEAKNIVSDNDSSYNLSMAFSDIELGNKSVSEALGDFDDSIDSGKLGYLFLISTIAGAFCAYVILGFVIDMGVRAVKLAYLQLIAPLPILTLVLPNQKKVFDAWLKKTTSCFIEVFTRIIAMSFAFYAIKYLRPWIFSDMSTVSCGKTVGAVTKLLAQAAFIVGVFAFLKQLPKLIKDLLPGFDSSGFKLGFGNAFAEAGGFQAIGTAGSTISSAAKSANWGINKFRDTKGENFLTRAGAALGAVNAFGVDTVKGGYKGYNSTKDVKKWADTKKAISNSAEEVVEERMKKDETDQANARAHEDWNAADYVKDAWKNFVSSDRANYNFQNSKHGRLSAVESAKKEVDSIDDNVMTKKAKTLNLDGFEPKEKTAESEKFFKKLGNIENNIHSKLSWNGVQGRTSDAEKKYNDALRLNTEAESMVGDEKFSSEYIIKARNEADAKVAEISKRISEAGLDTEELKKAQQEYASARVAQQAAYSLQADYSRTPEYVKSIQEKRAKMLEDAKQEYDDAQSFEKQYKDYLKEYLHGRSEKIDDIIGTDFKHEYENKQADLEAKLKAALGDLSGNPSRYQDVEKYIKSGKLADMLDAAKQVKNADFETLQIMNSIAEEMRKKEEGKK